MRLKLPKSGAPAWLLPTEAVVQQCSVKEMFLEISQNLASDYNFIKKDTLAQVFSYKFCEISKNNFFLTVHLRWLLLYRNVLLQSNAILARQTANKPTERNLCLSNDNKSHVSEKQNYATIKETSEDSRPRKRENESWN